MLPWKQKNVVFLFFYPFYLYLCKTRCTMRKFEYYISPRCHTYVQQAEKENSYLCQNVKDEILAAIKSEKVIAKHICKHSWTSGSSTEVAPIVFWSYEVSIQMDTHRNIFEKAIERILAAYPNLFKYGYFCINDGSCPAEVRLFYTDEVEKLFAENKVG